MCKSFIQYINIEVALLSCVLQADSSFKIKMCFRLTTDLSFYVTVYNSFNKYFS